MKPVVSAKKPEKNGQPSPLSPTQSPAELPDLTSTSLKNPLTPKIVAEVHPSSDLLMKNDTIRGILKRASWARRRGDTKKEVASFDDVDEAETKYQEFESFIRAVGRNMRLPEGCKPFERVLVESENGGKPLPTSSSPISARKKELKHSMLPSLRRRLGISIIRHCVFATSCKRCDSMQNGHVTM